MDIIMRTHIKIPYSHIKNNEGRFLTTKEKESRKNEILTWVRDNCADPYDRVKIFDSPGFFGNPHTLDFYFDDEEDAIAFKLRWG